MRIVWRRFAAIVVVATTMVACTGGNSCRGGSCVSAWTSMPDAPEARQEVGAAVLDGKLYLVGGLAEGGGSARVDILDLKARTWSRAPDLPEPLHHTTAVAYDGDLVVLGGFTSQNSLTATTANVYRLRDGGWSAMPPMRHARAAGGAAVVGDQIVVVAGQDGARLVAQTEIFDGSSWHDAEPIPTPRDHLGVAGDGRVVYAVGGRRRTMNSTLPTLERFDPRTNRWERLSDAPTPRGGLGAVVVDGKLIVTGGEGPIDERHPQGVFGELERFVEGRWGSGEGMRVARHGVGVATDGRVVYVALGGTRAGSAVSATVDVFRP